MAGGDASASGGGAGRPGHDTAAAIRACPGGTSVSLRVVPGARRTELLVGEDGSLRLRVAAPPVEGKANEAVLAFLAGALGLRTRALTLAVGERSRDKVVVVPGLGPAEVATALGVARPPDGGAGGAGKAGGGRGGG